MMTGGRRRTMEGSIVVDNDSHLFSYMAMIICVCKRLSCRDVNAAVDNGARTWAELRSELGIASTCGRCACEARAVMRQRLQGHSAAASVMPSLATGAAVTSFPECA
ncbi:(2Fe-2S)-binding protein [Polycyclovorans algicola]|uniref:(2Fe-2S)-binding protein n=1 Tax=Polycyclovorans algicola TaxID=616992 RepID=UPI0006947FC0|nr:(2Fe-2S)-binding protein [Polycyclovorans algicola]